jgi:KDO2-lipid IV(A) lauroyltransferase
MAGRGIRILRQTGESILICIGLAVIPFLPRKCLLSFSKSLGAIAFRRAKQLRRVIMANLDLAFGDSKPTAEKERIAKESFSTFALLVLDLLWFAMFRKRRIQKYVRFDQSFDHYFSISSSAVAVTAHFGNWEVLGVALEHKGDPCAGVASPLDNRFANAALGRMRAKTEMRGGAVRSAIRVLREGRKIALLLDQNVLPKEGGEFVKFFGRKVPNSKAVETLALRTSSPIVFIYCMVDWKSGVYTGYAKEPLRIEKGEDGVTERLTRMTEDVISKNPGSWLWAYKRWKFVPADEKEADYPFYARNV